MMKYTIKFEESALEDIKTLKKSGDLQALKKNSTNYLQS